ncbi:MAG: hypothetical protein U0L05_05810 [Schaedlerella sp.]|nr:hypothetical protein [Schaedlerella sp.]
MWQGCFWFSLILLLSSIVLSILLTKKGYKRKQIFNPFNIFFGGLTVSSIILFIPVYAQILNKGQFYEEKVFLLSLHNTLRLFLVDGDFQIIIENVVYAQEEIRAAYSLLAAVLFVVAPFLTFGVVLSFFKNVSAYKEFLLGYASDAFIFSELNEKSIEFARDLKKRNKKRMIIFTDVYVRNEETSYELSEQAREIGAITFKKDITVVNFRMHSRKRQLNFFIIGEDDDENVKQTLLLSSRYCDRENISLYVFSTSTNSELLLGNAQRGKIKIRRINMVQSLISRTLYDNGIEIFNKAEETEKEEKLISAVVIGLGLHGTEMSKALPWFCQMDGYRFEMNVYDIAPNAESRFSALCPEMMDEKYNHDFETKGEAHYSIDIHSGMNVDTKEFWDSINRLESITYAFIALGDDEMNIRTAVNLRTLLEKKGMDARIDAVVYNVDKKEALSGITNYSGQPYKINFIGDIRSSYSEDVILVSEIEAIALARHLKWGQEEEFWKYEYNYRSSVASAIHRKLKIECGISGADKPVGERTEEELWALRELEHRRWNAYIRSEGFTYAPVRNNLAKTHHCLVAFDKLSQKDQEKDDD